jgi:hypothetical protein
MVIVAMNEDTILNNSSLTLDLAAKYGPIEREKQEGCMKER